MNSRSTSSDSVLAKRAPRPSKRTSVGSVTIEEVKEIPVQETSSGRTMLQVDDMGAAVFRDLGVAPGTVETAEEATKNAMSVINFGDLVTLKLKNHGIIVGDSQLNTIGAEIAAPSSEPRGSGGLFAPEDYSFRICPKLSYRAKLEEKMIKKRQPRAGSVFSVPVVTNETDEQVFEEIRLRVLQEHVQNDHVLERIMSSEAREPLMFGETIQLLHTRSNQYIGMTKSPAACQNSNKMVSLLNANDESPACYFKIMPRFKVKSKGAQVYSLDDVVFESVEFDGYVLSGSSEFMLAGISPLPDVKLGRSLRVPRVIEVNGSLRRKGGNGMEGSEDNTEISFQMDVFARAESLNDKDKLTTLCSFRLFHPEFNGFLNASSDRDKGEVLDALEDEVKVRERIGSLPAHLAYLKELVEVKDPTHPSNLNAKAVWRFEPLNTMTAVPVTFNTPFRIRHVVTNKYLCVDSSRRAALSTQLNSQATRKRRVSIGAQDLEFYDCYLADLHSVPPSWLVFSAMPTTVGGETLAYGVTAIRIEHRTPDGRTLFFSDINDIKPNYADKSVRSDAPKSRVGFVASTTGLEVFKVIPVPKSEQDLLDKLLPIIPVVDGYRHRYLTSNSEETLPISFCEPLVRTLLDLTDMLVKGNIAALRDTRKSTADICSEADATNSTQLGETYDGEPNRQVQQLCFEIKLFDSLFNATLAPFSRVFSHTSNSGEISAGTGVFDSEVTSGFPAAVQKFLFVSIQRICDENQDAMNYFSRRSSRVWLSPTKRHRDSWGNLAVEQADDESGAAVLLSRLFSASRSVLEELVDDALLEKFKRLIKQRGPVQRLINLFGAVCVAEGQPIRFYQEACIRLLWLKEENRYDILGTFHEVKQEALASALHAKGFPYPYGKTTLPNGKPAPPHCRVQAGKDEAKPYLGKSSTNAFAPVGVVWRQQKDWGNISHGGDGSGLFWAPEDMGIPPIEPFGDVGMLVPLEHVCWVLEPRRLSLPVLNVEFRKFDPAKMSGGNQIRKKATATKQLSFQPDDRMEEYDYYRRKLQFSQYLIAEVNLFREMCKGRGYNGINWLEQSFSYDLLLNMASNPWLPYALRAAVVELLLVLYVDRFPQFEDCGTPSLPERLWVLEDEQMTSNGNKGRKSTIPVVDLKMEITDPAAFPEFFVPMLSSAAGKKDPVISMASDKKFFLLSNLCNQGLLDTGGVVVHVSGDPTQGLNKYTSALLAGQKALLDFGFQSNIDSIKEMCLAGAESLDGRNDKHTKHKRFDPPDERYREMGQNTVVVADIKSGIIESWFVVNDLAANYRLALLLGKFKAHVASNKRSSPEGVNKWASSLEFFKEFEGLFDTKSPKQKDSSELALASLSSKGDFNHALIDLMMYDSASIMSNALHLLNSNYEQRKALVEALQWTVVIPNVEIAVYNDIHQLRGDLSELSELVSTYSVWAVKSTVSGDFSDRNFSMLMRLVDQLLEFIFTPRLESQAPAERASAADHRGGLVRENSLDRIPLLGSNAHKKKAKAEDARQSWNMTKATSRNLDSSGSNTKERRRGKIEKKTETNGRSSFLLKELAKSFPAHPDDVSRGLEFFRIADSDHDGVLSKAELCDGARKILGLTEKHISSEDLAELAHDICDEDDESGANASSFINFLRTGADDSNYCGYFKDCDKDTRGAHAGTVYESEKIWSTDVAAKWISLSRGDGGKDPLNPDKFHQEVLRACNLQRILSDALTMDTDLAFTGGSKCTIAQKIESQRRITTMLRALLVLLKAFMIDDAENQKMAFSETFEGLKKLATPPEIRYGKKGQAVLTDELQEAHYRCYSVAARDAAGKLVKTPNSTLKDPHMAGRLQGAGYPQAKLEKWPSTIEETAQDVILAMFRTNEDLCLRLHGVAGSRHELLDTMAFAACTYGEGAAGAETSPALDLLFTMCCPTSSSTILEYQGHLVDILTDPRYGNLRSAIETCIKRAPCASTKESSAGEVKDQDPWRAIRLLKTTLKKGNVQAVSVLVQGKRGLNLDAVCTSFAACLKKRITETSAGSTSSGQSTLRALLPTILKEEGTSYAEDSFMQLGGDEISAAEEAMVVENYEEPLERSGVYDLLSLAVELVALLPFSEARARSKPLWELASALEPALSALSEKQALKNAERHVLRDLVDFFDSVLDKVDELGLVRDVINQQHREGTFIVRNVRSHLEAISASEHLVSHVSPRTQEAIERTILVSSQRGDEVNPVPKYSRSDKHTYFKIEGYGINTGNPNATPFTDLVDAFRSSVVDNSFIVNTIKMQRFQLLRELEKGTPGKSEQYAGAVSISWTQIVQRLVAYGQEALSTRAGTQDGTGGGDDQAADSTRGPTATTVLILELLQDHLVKARSFPLDAKGNVLVDANGNRSLVDKSGAMASRLELREPAMMSSSDRAEHREKQIRMMEAGSIDLAVHIMMAVEFEKEGDLPDKALTFLLEMLKGANNAVQSYLYSLLIDDTEGRFLKHISDRLERAAEEIADGKRFGLLDGDSARLTLDLKEAFQSAQRTVEFLASCVDGQHDDFKNLLREQPMFTSFDLDFIAPAIDLLCLLADCKESVELFCREELDIVRQLLEYLTELTNGPCAKNQLQVASSDIVRAANSIVVASESAGEPISESGDLVSCSAELDKAEADPSYVDLVTLSCRVLAACLEGRADRNTHEYLRERLDMRSLTSKAAVLHEQAQRFDRFTAEGDARAAVKLGALAHIWALQLELFPEMSRDEVSSKLMPHAEFGDTGVLGSGGGGDDLIEVVEVKWKGASRRVTFPRPPAMSFLSEPTKLAFLRRVQLEEPAKRLTLMMEETDAFIAEMEWVKNIAERSKAYRLVAQYQRSMRGGSYAIVLLLNMNLLFSPPNLSTPLNNLGNNQELEKGELASLGITLALGLLIILIYATLLTFQASTVVPLLAFKVDKQVAAAVASNSSRWHSMRALHVWGFVLLCNAGIVAMHSVNGLGGDVSGSGIPTFYWFVLVLNVPVAVSCFRNFIVVPGNVAERTFVVAYDTCVRTPLIRSQLVLLVLAVLGLFNSEFFTLLLFEIVNLSSALGSLMDAVGMRGPTLIMVFYLFVASYFACASFGLKLFPSAFNTSSATFKTALSAFWYLVYTFPSRGNLRAVLAPADPKSSEWLPRLAFDTGVYVWLGIVLSTSITALLVDALQSKRRETQTREESDKNSCFVCGLWREAYGNLGLDHKAPSFDVHCEVDHNPWAYVAFVYYLRTLEEADMTGVEYFVHRQMEEDAPWVPSKTSFVVEQDQAEKLKEKEQEQKEETEASGLAGNAEAVEMLVNKFAALEKAMHKEISELKQQLAERELR